MTRLFGRICTPSEAEIGVAAFRESLLEYPVSPIPWPERDSGQTTNATSGLSLQPSFGMFGPDGSFSKTSPESSGTTLSASGPSYRLWVTALRKSSSRRRKLAHPTSANGSSYWPTARTSGTNAAGKHGEGGMDLRTMVDAWPTPRGEDSESAGNHPNATDSLTGATAMWPTPRTITGGAESAERKQELGRTESGGGDLQSQARGFWMTPSANEDAAGTVDGQMQRMLTHQTKAFHPDPETEQAAGSFFPPSLPATAGEAPGIALAGETGAQPATHGEPSLASVQTSRRQLNPRFAAWLMGWQPEWTSLAPLNCDSRETVSCLSRPHMPSTSSNWPTPDTLNGMGGAMRAEQKGKHALSLHHAVEGWQ